VWVEKNDRTSLFASDASFTARAGLADSARVSYESSNFPAATSASATPLAWQWPLAASIGRHDRGRQNPFRPPSPGPVDVSPGEPASKAAWQGRCWPAFRQHHPAGPSLASVRPPSGVCGPWCGGDQSTFTACQSWLSAFVSVVCTS
jgi:hypothetical protein